MHPSLSMTCPEPLQVEQVEREEPGLHLVQLQVEQTEIRSKTTCF